MGENNSTGQNNGFLIGVEDKFLLDALKDVVVVGKVRGTINIGDVVYMSNVGDDDTPVMLTKVKTCHGG